MNFHQENKYNANTGSNCILLVLNYNIVSLVTERAPGSRSSELIGIITFSLAVLSDAFLFISPRGHRRWRKTQVGQFMGPSIQEIDTLALFSTVCLLRITTLMFGAPSVLVVVVTYFTRRCCVHCSCSFERHFGFESKTR